MASRLILLPVEAELTRKPEARWTDTMPALIGDVRAGPRWNRVIAVIGCPSRRPASPAAAGPRLKQPGIAMKTGPSAARGGGDVEGRTDGGSIRRSGD